MSAADFQSFAVEMARRSGEFILEHFRTDLAVETKADATPVTVADRGAELLMREMIQRRFPDHGVRGEEYPPYQEDARHVWVLDPIDGTKSFVAGVPLFGTLIALLEDGQPILGVIHQPVLGQLLVGDGARATLNGRPARVRPRARIEDAVLLTTDFFDIGRHQDGAAFERLARRARLVRTWGDCYGYALLATGHADVMCDPVMAPWDILALIPVVRGAGGVITDWQGGDPVTAKSIVAAGPALHAAVVEALGGG